MFPELINPVQMAFDTKGRLWVAAWQSYPHWKPTEPMDDKLLILEDTNGDGRADVCKTFAGGLHNPTGFEFYGGGVIVAMAPDLLMLKDLDGDDRADTRQRILQGLDSADTHHTSNSFVLDPGGALYFQEGTFHHTQVETPYGPPVRSANAAVFRFEPGTFRFDVYVAYGFANPHGHVFDRWGQDFVHDGTGAVPFHGALFSGHLDFPDKHRGPPTLYQQRTRPCPATELVSGSHFPPDSQGNLLVANVIGLQGILQYRIKDRGASFEAEEIEPILFSSDPNFRPVDMEIAPDGSLYFTDWQNPVIGHMQHNLRDPSRDRIHGRVYRVRYPDRPLMTAPEIAGRPIDELVALLANPADRVRYRAKIELSGRPSPRVLDAAKRWMAQLPTDDPQYEHHLLEVLWLHQYHDVVNRELLERMLASSDFRARAAAVRVMCCWRDRLPDALDRLKSLAADEHPRVRLEAIRAASFFPVADAVEVPLISTEYPTDEYLDYTRNETMRALEPYWKRALADGQPIAVTSPVGLRWLLQRVGVDELTRMPRSPEVNRELLWRDGVQEVFRQEAIVSLAKSVNQSRLQVLLGSITTLDEQADGRSALFDLGRLLANWPATELAAETDRLQQLAMHAQTPTSRQIGLVGLMMAAGNTEPAWQLATTSPRSLKDLAGALPMLPDPLLQDQLYARVAELLDKLPDDIERQLEGRSASRGTYGRYVRIELPGRRRTLTLAEVEVMSDGRNVAGQGRATQSATAHEGVASKAIDGNRGGTYGAGGQTHTPEDTRDPWWELDLGDELPLESIVVYNRTDGDLGRRLDGFSVKVLDSGRNTVFAQDDLPAPAEQVKIPLEAGGPQGTVRRAAMSSLPYVRGHEADTFARLARFVVEDIDRLAAMRAIMRIPTREWPADQVPPLLDLVLAHVRGLPEAERSLPAGADALQLADALASRLPPEQAQPIRRELRGLGVRKLRLGTVPHRMVYDQDRLVVEAGKRAEIVFENNDIMPHNFVITQPGALEEIGLLAEATAQQPGALQRHFVPQSDRILVSSELLQPRDSQTIAFTAPREPGICPYVCTYPGHWRRMYGSLFVVADLDAFEADADAYLAAHGIEARDELLKSVRPIQQWKLEDLAAAAAELDQGRSFATGRRMFQLATCTSCHRLAGEGNEIGPDLTKLDVKLRPSDVLRHMIEPSWEINKDYQTFIVELNSGHIVTGLLVGQNETEIQLMENPLVSTQPRVIQRSEIAEQTKSPKSTMPEGLLDRLTREEILDLLAYVYARANEHDALFAGEHHH
jgi:putative heme-binding domain-containing protein